MHVLERHPHASGFLVAWLITSLMLAGWIVRLEAPRAAVVALMLGCGLVAGGLTLWICRGLLAEAMTTLGRRARVLSTGSVEASWLVLPGLFSVPLGTVLVLAVLASL